MKAVLIFGFGVSGRAAAEFLLRQARRLFVVDRRADELVVPEGVELFGEEEAIPLDEVELLILSPGIAPDHPLVRRAYEVGIEVVGEAQFALTQLKNCILAISGTNGKTTATLLVEHVLNYAGFKARALGNVGTSLSSYLSEVCPEEILVVELSSFQLETLQERCLSAAALLNITPDHLDRYVSMEAYVQAKLKLQNCLQPEGKLFVSEKVAEEYGAFLREYEIVRGSETIALARRLCQHLGVSSEEFDRARACFPRQEHRIEWVGEINGVLYYNDSKATNRDAVIHAVRTLEGPILLLAGGVHKGASYAPWVELFRKKVKRLIAFGSAAPVMERELSSALPFLRVDNLEEALFVARQEADEGDTVLLSPGCSSYDQFRDYQHRGDEFKRIVWTAKKPS